MTDRTSSDQKPQACDFALRIGVHDWKLHRTRPRCCSQNLLAHLREWASSYGIKAVRAIVRQQLEFCAIRNLLILHCCGVLVLSIEHKQLIQVNNQRTCIRTVFVGIRSEEHTSELQFIMRISYAVLCLKKKTTQTITSN